MEQTDDAAKLKDKYGSLGTFVLQLWREQSLGSYEGASYFSAEALKPVPEKALKGNPLEVAAS